MITGDGWDKYSIWEHSAPVKDLYARRCRMEAEEMTCAAQAAELVAPLVAAGDTLLDAGCGAGYFYHSLRTRAIPVEYYGIDASPSLIEIGKQYLPAFNLPADRLQLMCIEDLDGSIDHVVCMNVLSNIDNYHRCLERLLHCARKSVIIRESCHTAASYRYVTDRYLDDGHELRVYVNTYETADVMAFIRGYGYVVEQVTDRRSQGQPELVIDYPHYWTFLVATRQPGSPHSVN